MKIKKQLIKIIGVSLILSSVLGSCSTSKKSAVKCPEFQQNRYYKVSGDNKRTNNRELIVYGKASKRKPSSSRITALSVRKQQKDFVEVNHSRIEKNYAMLGIEQTYNLNKNDYLNGLTASIINTAPEVNKLMPLQKIYIPIPINQRTNLINQGNDILFGQPDQCDTIILISGSMIIGKVAEIGLSEVKYRRCDNLDGPVISISKSDISVIKYINGTKDYFTSNSAVTNNYDSDTRKIEGLGLAGFISGIVGLFIFGIPLGLVAMIFGGISLIKIEKQPTKYKGKGFALASLIVGTVGIIAMIFLLAGII
jgi:hypothetical protein